MADTHRFFRASPQLYEQIREQLDLAWGHGEGTGTLTCYSPVDEAPKDANGNALLAVRREFCAYSVASQLLPMLLASGDVVEITREQYLSDPQPPQLVAEERPG